MICVIRARVPTAIPDDKLLLELNAGGSNPIEDASDHRQDEMPRCPLAGHFAASRDRGQKKGSSAEFVGEKWP